MKREKGRRSERKDKRKTDEIYLNRNAPVAWLTLIP
jgi:hypothetical protein